MNTDNLDDHRALENELRAALAHRAEQVRPSDRWEEIAMTTAKAPTTTRRWPIVLLAAAALMGCGAGILDMVLSPIVSALEPERRTWAMNWLHSF